ncbi:MAG: YfcE family phosphodiesterase [Clostridia bacterium]|nr:YfcE family phosphodiesterase [Clostridia bacterium]
MRIGVVSDSHGFTGRLSTILMVMEAEKKPLDALIHLGDGYYDLRDLQVDLPVYQAAGNCDPFCSDTLNIVNLSGARLVLTHGHYQHVKEGLDDLLALAIQEKAQAALYGHTHLQRMEWRNGILLLNPGAAMDGRFAILRISRLGAVEAELRSLY